jgi:F-type H+-transporting ATPase subunit b
MGGILSQLEQLFIQTIPTVIFVFALYVILSRSFFRPLALVLKEREEATTGAMARARELMAAAEEKLGHYQAALQAARQEVYRQREAARRSILEDRQATLKRAQQHSLALISEAQASLKTEVARSKKELESACQSLGREIAETVLGASEGSGGGGLQP